MVYIPHIIGGFGVLSFLISYQQKKRSGIIVFNLFARLLFVVQYILLLAFEGAVQNGVGAVGAVLAENKDKAWLKTKVKYYVMLIYLLVIASGILSWKTWFSILPIIGMLFQCTALWLNSPKCTRLIMLAGIPFWFVYNYMSRSYAGMTCDILSTVSIVTAMVRLDLKSK